ncbi:MAG: S-adenosylmethionine:tRNA ribosyltransferase-isomerase [Runella zeae]
MNSSTSLLPEIPLAEFQYELPDERIARYPVSPRDSSKLLVYQNGTIAHQSFEQLPELLPASALLVFNDTKVIPARVFFQKDTGAHIEVFLLHPEAPSRVINEAMQQMYRGVWSCMIGNKKRWKIGETLSLRLQAPTETYILEATLIDSSKNWVEFRWRGESVGDTLPFVEVIKVLGNIPLPPYLGRDADANDSTTYQTVYSKIEGAVAAPTAGLHFTDRVFEALAKKGIEKSFVTLHVGAGTFQPVKVQNAVEHTMHAEQVIYRQELIQNLLEKLGQVVVVGTTSMRSLESLYWFGVKLCLASHQATSSGDTSFFIEKLAPYQSYAYLPSAAESLSAVLKYMKHHQLTEMVGETEIMIFPGYDFKICTGLITNFHQPGSTLMLLVAAFVGTDWKKIYTEALSNNYRFLSYGDSSLLWKKQTN